MAEMLNGKRAEVLVVDDEKTVCQSVEKILERMGFHVEQSLTVATALESIESGKRFDLIVADLMMPQVGGMELLKTVRTRWPDMAVLMMTGYASISAAVEAMKHGAVGFLPKPFTPEELTKAVDAAMKRLTAGPAPELPEPGPIDVDMPFDAREVAKQTSPGYVDRLNRSDVQRAETKPVAPPPDFCPLGNRTCKRFVSKGVCKQPECPIVVAERRKNPKPVDLATILNDPIDVDMPFSASELARYTSDAYVAAMGRSDLPIVGRWPEARPAVAAEHRVLVVDDEAVVVNSIRKTLTRKGFVVDEAFTGAEALSWVAGHEYDLVLLDMKLPDVIGLDLLPKIKRIKPELPVVIVTGYASIDTAVEAIRRGATDYMAKPFTPDELYTLAGRIVEQHQVHA